MAGIELPHILDRLVNHVAFPPRLPSREDSDDGETDRALARCLAKYSRAFRSISDPRYYQQWSIICRTLDYFAALHSTGHLDIGSLKNAFFDISRSNNDVLIIHISLQNAGLIIWKAKADEFIFETFEASPRAADVLASTDALEWDFPSRAVAIPSETFEDPRFQEQLAGFLGKASVESVKEFAATTAKAGSLVFESRDTPDPALIGQLLMALLEANGSARPTLTTRKRVRDDVCWDDGAQNPWRRSAAWLVLRVGIQRSLCFLLGGDIGTIHYKFFISYFIARICDEMIGIEPIKPEYLAHVRAKLARRLAKLEAQQKATSATLISVIRSMFDLFNRAFSKTLMSANNRLAAEWVDIRRRSLKPVPRLPRRADERSLVLSLTHSRDRLIELCQMSPPSQTPFLDGFGRKTLKNLSGSLASQTKDLQKLDVYAYLRLADFEYDVELNDFWLWPPLSQTTAHEQCAQLAKRILEYQRTGLPAYGSDPEQLSLMLLTIMELWVALDLIALELFPLLGEYSTGIPPEILYVLQLARFSDLRRLHAVENHLQKRQKSARNGLPSVFSDPSERCFAVRYFDQCESMQGLLMKIKSDGDKARGKKKEEWERKHMEYEGLLKKAAENNCLRYEVTDRWGNTYFECDSARCKKHRFEFAARKLTIKIHEYPLSDNQNAAKCTVFELLCPRGFIAWRDTTWNIISGLGRESHPNDRTPLLLLHDYSQLHNYDGRQCGDQRGDITLASRTKSFLLTHYKELHISVPLEGVCLPNGLHVGLYSQQQRLWTSKRTERPSFAHHCTLSLPPKPAFNSFGSNLLRAVSCGYTRSANEIIASQSECPASVTVFEYLGFQELSLGTKLRWVQILRELASPYLNFGSQATVALVSQLALQVGNPWEGNILRASHWAFKDDQFCAALVAQIDKRLQAISSNWHECQALECLVTLTYRLWELGGSVETVEQATSLFRDIRSITLSWMRSLRREILIAVDAKSAKARSRDALFAALLCRRTFILESYDVSDHLEPEALTHFIESSIVLSDNILETGPDRISLPFRNALIRDLKIVHRLEKKLRHSILRTSAAVDRAMNGIWPEPDETPPRTFTTWEFLPAPNDKWISAQSIGIDGMRSQAVHYNTVDGSLLVDGQRLGRLPEQYTSQGLFHQFLGDRLYLTYPSCIPGMSCMLAHTIEGNQVHFGFRDGKPFMRAIWRHQTFELIPPEVFIGSKSLGPDLPMSLIDKHVHWLDLASGILHITPQATMWRSKYSDWNVCIWTCKAQRRNSILVDVRSPIFRSVASIIEPFEHRSRMIVFQPQKGNLSVHLPNLELSFEVNPQGLLKSRQLRAVIDDDQDAGTLYGLDSKLVLRDEINSRERSIAVSMGPTTILPYMGHIRARTEHSGFYCRFSINTILNRLECPAEPRVVYMKAFCHAITSFVLADPLTGRTGTEEALHCLASGTAQPWAPVDQEAYRLLSLLADLSPKRSYYPTDMKVQQKVIWNEILAFPAQDDRFYPAVAHLLRQCAQLSRFNTGAGGPPPEIFNGDRHLMKRACVRNRFRRLGHQNRYSEKSLDIAYLPRDRASSGSRTNAFEAASLIKRRSRRIDVSRDLAGILQGWPTIQGYQDDQRFEMYLLEDLLSIDIALHWGSLFKYCQELSRRGDLHRAMFFFATISFSKRVNMAVMRTLIAFAVMKEFQSLSGPKWDTFVQFRKDQLPTIHYLVQLMLPSRFPYLQDEWNLLEGIPLCSKQRRRLEMDQAKHEKKVMETCETVAKHLLSQWPCEIPSVETENGCQLIDLGAAIQLVRPEWLRLFQNYELWRHLQDVQRILNCCEPPVQLPTIQAEVPSRGAYPKISSLGVVPMLQDIMNAAEIPSDPHPVSLNPNQSSERYPTSSVAVSHYFFGLEPDSFKLTKGSMSELWELQRIIDPFVCSENLVRRAYGTYLQKSLVALQGLETKELRELPFIDPARLKDELLSARDAVYLQFDSICNTLNQNLSFTWLNYGGLWPSLTPVTLLETLGTSSSTQPPGRLRHAIITYGELITVYQRLLRIQAAYNYSDDVQLRGELENESHAEWRPKDHPDWLLLEIENNILIRNDQYRVAKAMMTPELGSNSVLQMNMGKGKSSVIIPMIAAMLANGRQLFRVIIPKPLLLQMAQILQVRLGGLLGRAVKHVPFSRRSSTSKENIQAYWNLQREALEGQNVMLALPEHLLSFKLSGLQCLSSGKTEEATFMMQVKSWLMSKSRDVLDECDHSLAVKTQLVYPSGAQSMVDGHPNRWKVAQAVLQLVKGSVVQLQRDFPQGIEVIDRARSGGFPEMHFSQASVKDALIRQITDSVYRGEGGILPVNDCTKDELDTVAGFLNSATFSRGSMSKVSNIFRDRPDARRDLLLLRGLLVHRILLMALTKRWNVQYGLHPRRDPVAVPFQAKGVPSEQAEFGHPDVAILLTCLSFYYSGLEISQFDQVLKHVSKSDDPAMDYDRWVQCAGSLPDSVRAWDTINIDDDIRRKELWVQFRYNMAAIDCFLNNFVFPNHAKTFERKLASSAWDVPLPAQLLSVLPDGRSNVHFPPRGTQKAVENSTPLTTGFSGTNDNRTLLPLNIEQRDLKELEHTNAEVLTYLLKPRNRKYKLIADRHGRRLSEVDFLHLISWSRIRMLLDAGAQILEFDNFSLVKKWLEIDTSAEAAVYFDEGDIARILYRDGRKQPLVASPYVGNLGACVVYLDEAHTRGTDLKMPLNSVAALTLGPNQTKDHTVQAMRLRQLATLQSVVFFAPPEVHQSILNVRGKDQSCHIDSHDVISWLLDQTCRAIEQVQPLYISHGLDYCCRTSSAFTNQNAASDPEHRSRYLKALEQPEQYSLERLYSPRRKAKALPSTTSSMPLLAEYVKTLNHMKENMRDTGDTVQALAHQEVEQEREQVVEVEVVREVKKPPKAAPLRHLPLHRDLVDFVKTGRLIPNNTTAYEQAFVVMRRTSIGIRLGISSSATQSKIFVTSDFTRTIAAHVQLQDEHLRPVQWVLWSTVSNAAIIISPHEAEALIDEIRDSKTPCTHLISYAAPATRSMLVFDSLNFFSVPCLPLGWRPPRWLVRDLGLFAGRLYFEYTEYPFICKALGVRIPNPCSNGTGGGESLQSSSEDADGPLEEKLEPFSNAPFAFLQQWLAIRRKGQDFSQTPMGHVCCGKEVKENLVFFAC